MIENIEKQILYLKVSKIYTDPFPDKHKIFDSLPGPIYN